MKIFNIEYKEISIKSVDILAENEEDAMNEFNKMNSGEVDQYIYDTYTEHVIDREFKSISRRRGF